MKVIRNVEVSDSRNVNKGLPEWVISLAVIAGAIALEIGTRVLLDPSFLENLPPAALPIAAAVAVTSKDAGQLLRRIARDRTKIYHAQVDESELPR
jgi:hypothetical protein